MTAQMKTDSVALTAEQYHALAAPPPELPTPGQLFDWQAANLTRHELCRLEELMSLRERLKTAGKLFLIVPKKPKIATREDLNALIGKLAHEGKTGVNYLAPEHLADEVETPKNGYLMTEVEDGRAMLNVAPRDACLRLSEAKRSPFTWWEGFIFHLNFGFALWGHHNVDCSGSRYGSRDVPSFYLNDGKPRFGYDWDDCADQKWGSASSRERIGA